MSEDNSTGLPDERRRALRQSLLGDWGLKVVATVLALAFWASVQASEDKWESLELNVRFVAPEGRMVVGDKPHKIVVNAVGSRQAMNRFKSRLEDRTIAISADSLGVGTSTIFLNRDLLGLPSALRMESVRPAMLRIEVARRVSRHVPVVVDIKGTPSAGLKVKRWVVTPDHVTIDGPEKAVTGVEAVKAGPVIVDKVMKDIVRMVPLRTGAMGVRVLDLHEAEVRVEIAAPMLDRRFEGVPVVVSPDWSAQPATIALELKGPLDSLNRLHSAELKAVVQGLEDEGIRSGQALPLRLEGLPQGVVRLGPLPEVKVIRRADPPSK